MLFAQNNKTDDTSRGDLLPTDRSGPIDPEAAQSTKKAPFQQPKSFEFFEALKRNDVLICLKMLKEN